MAKVLDHYIHIDNGGYMFSIDVKDSGPELGGYYISGFEVSNSFYGYGINSIKMTLLSVDQLEELGKKLVEAASKIREMNGE